MKTLNLRFTIREYNILKDAYESTEMSSWEKFFIMISKEILEELDHE